MNPLFVLGVLAQTVSADAAVSPATAPGAAPYQQSAPASAETAAPYAQAEAPAVGALRVEPNGMSPPIEPPVQRWQPRRFGIHLGINATFLFDVTLGRWLYFGAATQLTGFGAIAAPERNFNLSLQAFGGVGLPVIETVSMRFTIDATPALTYTHAAPVNLLSIGLLAGVRLQHRSGFTFAVKLPLVGYAGGPDAQRGGLLMYYTNAIVTVPAITFGYSF